MTPHIVEHHWMTRMLMHSVQGLLDSTELDDEYLCNLGLVLFQQN